MPTCTRFFSALMRQAVDSLHGCPPCDARHLGPAVLQGGVLWHPDSSAENLTSLAM